MAGKEPFFDFSVLDFSNLVATTDQIREFNEQRFEMEQLSGILFEDPVNGIAVGYKDVTENEFWVRGHMPGGPLMPGIIMCEAAAQLCSYYAKKLKMADDKSIIGFAGMEDVRFRGIVVPGDRMIVAVKWIKLTRLLVTCEFQCFVDKQLVCHGIIKGTPIPKAMIYEQTHKKTE